MGTSESYYYNRNPDHQRSDLTYNENLHFWQKHNTMQGYLQCMSNFLFREAWRSRIFYDRYFNIEDHKGMMNQFAQLNNNKLSTFRFNNSFSENENIAMVNFMDKVLFRLTKYKLMYPIFGKEMSKEQVKQEEGELTQLFIREMRKKPFKKGGKSAAADDDE